MKNTNYLFNRRGKEYRLTARVEHIRGLPPAIPQTHTVRYLATVSKK